MAKRWDALTVREKDGKSYWTKIGAMFEGRDGFVLHLDALPIDGKVVMREPKARDGGNDAPRGGQRDNDDIPF